MKKKLVLYIMLVLFLPISILFWLGASWQVMTLFLIASVLLIITTNTDKIQSITVGKDNMELTMKEAKEVIKKAEKANEQLGVTIEKLNSTIIPLLDFSLGLLEKDGEFDNVTKFDYVESFLTSAIELYKEIGEIDTKIESLIKKCNHKLVYSFIYEIKMKFPELSIHLDNLILDYPEIKINFVELNKLANKLQDDQRDYYLNIIDRMEKYYKNNII